ncbi:hypothetical protein PILCRDRAFT_602655 [Piloderma croceum F 1598]|uniref:Uncharacterized protein n=1 Tax=Piloderma croceum (strain F 1598) TaxID=765440 RepID=A0A0C3FDT1_PILCF|nr:hypothetical protein PILCRDRAFT_602655 [Piloderma croceum F 1598]
MLTDRPMPTSYRKRAKPTLTPSKVLSRQHAEVWEYNRKKRHELKQHLFVFLRRSGPRPVPSKLSGQLSYQLLIDFSNCGLTIIRLPFSYQAKCGMDTCQCYMGA